MHSRGRMTIRPPHPYNAGTEHVGFSPTRQTSRAPNAKKKRREVFGERVDRTVSCILLRMLRTTFGLIFVLFGMRKKTNAVTILLSRFCCHDS